MEIVLTEQEVRVLGSLMEKELATPDYYPLTLNSLLSACNQKSNRDPVVAYDEPTLVRALDGLRGKKLVLQSTAGRAARFEQLLGRELKLLNREQAVLCILLVRGPQTIGEIRNRTERLYPFADLDEVQAAAANLEDMGLIARLPRQPGHKESRFTHLLCGMVAEVPSAPREATPADDRLTLLERQVDGLRQDLASLAAEFRAFKANLE